MDRIGGYVVRRKIADGGMGAVYEAEEVLAGRRVALKVLRDGVDGARLVSELRRLARLDHPNIVRSVAFLRVDGQLVSSVAPPPGALEVARSLPALARGVGTEKVTTVGTGGATRPVAARKLTEKVVLAVLL
jgi:hypothetical protein